MIDTTGMVTVMAVIFGIVGWGMIELGIWIFSNISVTWGG